MSVFPASSPYYKVYFFPFHTKSFLISLIPGFGIVGCAVISVPFVMAYSAIGLGLCCAVLFGLKTGYTERWG